jgi:hypothetical protein
VAPSSHITPSTHISIRYIFLLGLILSILGITGYATIQDIVLHRKLEDSYEIVIDNKLYLNITGGGNLYGHTTFQSEWQDKNLHFLLTRWRGFSISIQDNISFSIVSGDLGDILQIFVVGHTCECIVFYNFEGCLVRPSQNITEIQIINVR